MFSLSGAPYKVQNSRERMKKLDEEFEKSRIRREERRKYHQDSIKEILGQMNEHARKELNKKKPFTPSKTKRRKFH